MLCSGESYLDVIARLQPVIIEMERLQEPLLIVGHQVCDICEFH
jgi:broad specificity phosphatase PhoE